jgi:hypothetical protein
MSDTNDLKTILSPRDQSILDATTGTSWVPKDPIEPLLPYVGQEATKEKGGVEERREKAKEIFDQYGKVIENCKELEDEIVERCKNVVVTLDPSQHLRIIEAVQRVFGTDGTQITFQMYQRCIKELAKVSGDSIPQPGGIQQ